MSDVTDVTNEGTTNNLVRPKIDESTFEYNDNQFGAWLNRNNVRMVKVGMNKSQISNYWNSRIFLKAHFSGGLFGVREWDYVFNDNENGAHKICQYKFLFDKNMNAQSFFSVPRIVKINSFNQELGL